MLLFIAVIHLFIGAMKVCIIGLTQLNGGAIHNEQLLISEVNSFAQVLIIPLVSSRVLKVVRIHHVDMRCENSF
jgi:hypothetical protein